MASPRDRVLEDVQRVGRAREERRQAEAREKQLREEAAKKAAEKMYETVRPVLVDLVACLREQRIKARLEEHYKGDLLALDLVVKEMANGPITFSAHADASGAIVFDISPDTSRDHLSAVSPVRFRSLRDPPYLASFHVAELTEENVWELLAGLVERL